MKKSILLLIVLCFFLAAPAIGQITLPFSDDFESYTIGDPLPPPWENGAGGPGIVADIEAHSGIKSVTPVNTFASAVLDLGNYSEYTDYLQYEGWFRSDGGGAIIGFHEQFSNMLPVFNAIRVDNNGDVYFDSADRDTGFHIQIGWGLSPDWHHVRVQLNFSDLLGNVWLDGTLVLDSVPISPKDWVVYGTYGEGPLRHIGFSHYAGGPVYFDDFSVTESMPSVDIKVYGSDGPILVAPGEEVDITVSLDPGAVIGKRCDWRVCAMTHFGTYWLNPSLNWVKSDTPISVGQWPLFDLDGTSVFNNMLPEGIYTFYFALDDTPDWIFDLTWYDYVIVVCQGDAAVAGVPDFDSVFQQK